MTHVGFLLADNSRLARWAFDQRVREIGVTGPQARMLLTLNRAPGENQGFYAEQLEVEPITLCRMADRLEEAGLIERRRDPADRRAWQLHLTAKAHTILEQLQDRIDSLLEDMLAGLSAEERAEFARLLNTIGSNLTAHRETVRAANG
ncbi:MarR family winged helix-turn-helix transcriptional regulator [Altericroceibacterium xinjiangense]|uniref:MarR family winged helix-turn-helix transcriptional regulator n=1 Tax=Altericroceibacterium xinjiangense TaxID=762261 RepID=UPI000F7F6C25|nr:MarR family transcriptional regulator [Altericroceibacterium xinjiangense]